MKQFHWSGNYVVWGVIELGSMAVAAFATLHLIIIAGQEMVGRAFLASTVLLSVAVAIVIQLWVKLNELSGLSSLSVKERQDLWSEVHKRVRALVWLVVFFLAFIFFVIGACAASARTDFDATRLLVAAGAGFGASIVLIAAVLVDLNEIAQFRWLVEITDHTKKKKDGVLDELKKHEPGFERDEHIQGYKRVSNGE